MANIIPKLNLNKTPNSVESNSLIFARNIRLDVNGEIHKDYGIKPLTVYGKFGHRGSYKDIIYKAIFDTEALETTPWYSYFLDNIKEVINYYEWEYVEELTYGIVGEIPDSTGVYLFFDGYFRRYIPSRGTLEKRYSCILFYDENTDTVLPCNCNWHYSGGKIDGSVITNLIGEKILNIGEIIADDVLIPFKCINLSKSSYEDDESIYTQTPNIPVTNLEYVGTFSYVIPCGVYQFFIRYKIRDNFYTDWFPASKELFAGNENTVNTNYGTLKYINTHKDSDSSFVFNVDTLFTNYTKNYESFQIGFILSHDDAVYARAWKHFNFTQNSINFDYNANDAEEIEITDLLKSSYQLYNVGNVTSFKNKLYISNYVESNINEELQSYANNVEIEIKQEESTDGYDNYPVIQEQVGSIDYITGLTIDNNDVFIQGTNGIINQLVDSNNNVTSVKDVIKASLNGNVQINDAALTSGLNSKYGFNINFNRQKLSAVQSTLIADIKARSNRVSGPNFLDNNEVYAINIDGIYQTIDAEHKSDIDYIYGKIIEYIVSSIKYLTYKATFLTEGYSTKSSFNIIIYRRYEWQYYSERGRVDRGLEDGRESGIVTQTSNYYQKLSVSISADINKISISNIEDIINRTTLIPYQKYKFYIHYVKQTGEISNGYFCDGINAGEIEIPYKDKADAIIYPKFSNITLPPGYVACFLSIFHSSVYVSSIFNIEAVKNNNTVVAIEGSCVEANTRLIPMNTKIQCRKNQNDSEILVEGNYHYSSDSSIIRYFGADGIIEFAPDSDIDTEDDNLLYAINDYQSQQEIDVTLTKCTPYIKTSEYDKPKNLNLLGYICDFSPLNRERATGYYSDGTNVYKKANEYNVNPISNTGLKVELTELGKYTDSTYKVSDFNLISTNLVKIYSNFNLNYLSLSEDVKDTIKTYYNHSSSASTTSNDSKSILWKLLTSLTLSDIYILPSMYKNYTRKQFYPYQKDAIIKFDNTVRSSELIEDEAGISIYRFDAEDYYNVPTNRGIIVNLISVGDAILVHTKDSMFKFTGSNNLSGSTGEIVTNETEPFDTGISEIFGSDFGFAGLQDKEESIMTENGYIFFDRDAKIVYMYSGQNRIDKLSDKIKKLFDYDVINKVRFANDFYNNRFFICIYFKNGKSITLSYNTLEQSKSFVSIHDFKFDKAFNTKTKCYFNNGRNLCVVDKDNFGIYEGLEENNDDFYPSRTINISENRTNIPTDTSYLVKLKESSSIIDVIVNENYDIVKTLDYIEWCSKFINEVYPGIDTSNVETLLIAEPKSVKLPCSYIRIYTDTCCTDLLDCSKDANRYNINNPAFYSFPRYNQGKWTLNYFRNILNSEDKFEYNSPQSDLMSLIEGKYFVVRLVFDTQVDFKLETLEININNKL